MVEKCAYCKWFQEIDEEKGFCKKNAPDCKCNFPIVKRDDYCGDFLVRYSKEKADKVIFEIADRYCILARNKKESEEIRYIVENAFRILWNTGTFPTDGAVFDDAFDEGKYVCYVISENCLVRAFCLTALRCSKEELKDINYLTLEEFRKMVAAD